MSTAGENNPDEEVWMNSRTEPAAHLFTVPTASKYSSPYDGYYSRGPAKRFMVRKKRAAGGGGKEKSSPRLGLSLRGLNKHRVY